MGIYTTEITSDRIPSDNPIHQRLLKAYHLAEPFIKGDLLELGCGEGRGVSVLAPLAKSYTAIDKIETVIETLAKKYPEHTFLPGSFPPFPFKDNSFDTIVTFQVIEHIKNDHLFLREIYRVLKPGGQALMTTPNIKMTLSRNPWHVREYTAEQLTTLCEKYFDKVEMMGVAGNDKVMEYHEQNRKSVQKIMKYDFLDLQHRLPAPLLRLPYDILNRLNRKKLQGADDELVKSISQSDYYIREMHEQNLDLFCLTSKQNS